jgi:hypothetical protein
MTETRITRAAFAGASIDYPEAWDVIEQPDAVLAIALPGDWSVFRPMIVLTIADASVPITDLSDSTMRMQQEDVPGTHIVACDLWPYQNGIPGRRIRYFSPVDGSAVVATRWIWSTGSRVLSLTASCLPSQSTEFDPAASWVASNLVVTQ